MANGRRMNPNSDIAASKTLPLGSVAKVTNLDNGKSTTVTIQDRGPFVDGRMLDLAPKAAQRLDMKTKGRRIGGGQADHRAAAPGWGKAGGWRGGRNPGRCADRHRGDKWTDRIKNALDCVAVAGILAPSSLNGLYFKRHGSLRLNAKQVAASG
jgi:hypothetical protein